MANSVEKALYIVATPIGNLEDITLRAVDVLKNVDIIACEDTRNTKILLDKYSINTKLVSYHKFNELKKSEFFINCLKEGRSIALVSDAGTPLVSDPGAILVKEVRKENFKIIPVAGACAIAVFLSSIYREGEDFKFAGFLPRVENQITEILKENKYENLIFYESPNRIIKTFEIIEKIYPDKVVSFARELTKKFEEIKTDTIKNLLNHFKNNSPKGEFVIMLHKSPKKSEIDIDEKIEKLKNLKLKDKEIANIISSLYGVNRNTVYKKCIE